MQQSNPSLPRTTAFRFLLLFVSLFAVSLPFPYHLLPDVGGVLSPLSSALARSSVGIFLPDGRPYVATIVSDGILMYIHVLDVAAVAAALALLWSALDRRGREHRRLRYLFHAAISYYLSLQLLKYGLDKIFKHQFYLPEPNTLYTPLGHLTRDILYWSTLGASYSYNVVTGVMEVVPAILLLFRRTRIIGALWALAVVAHIVAINVAFDISVKLYSIFLLLLCAIVAAPGLRKLVDLFIRNRQVTAVQWSPTLDPSGRLIYAAVKAVAIVAILVEGLYPYVAANNFNDDLAARPPLHGAYDVESFVLNGEARPPLLTDTARLRRIFIHRRGYLITEGMNDRMRDYPFTLDEAAGRMSIGGGQSVLEYTLSGGDSTLDLRGVLEGDSIVIRARRIDLSRLPLLQPSFHWTIDSYR